MKSGPVLEDFPPLTLSEAQRIVRKHFAHHRDECSELLYIYLIQAGDCGPVKLGIAKDPRARLATLQIGNPAPLRGLYVWLGSPIEERAWQECFADAHIRGEWFRPIPDLLEFGKRWGDPWSMLEGDE